MTKIKLQATIIEGNNQKLKELAEECGLSATEFISGLAELGWYSISPDVIMNFRSEKKKISKELQSIDKLLSRESIKNKPKEKLNNIYITPEIETKLRQKANMHELSMGGLLNKACKWPIRFYNSNLLNGYKTKGGRKKITTPK